VRSLSPKFKTIPGMQKPFDISDIKHVKRFVIGNNSPQRLKTEAELEDDLAKMNQYIVNHKGKIVGQEKNFVVLQMGEHQCVVQYIVYHVGFTRVPY
jgi:hypothetical protein